MLSMEVSLAQLPDFAKSFIAQLPKTKGAQAYIVGLSGDLGTGKTAFVQQIAKALGVFSPVTSPTFVLAQTYQIQHAPFSRLVHIDAYRLSPDEKDTFGWKEYAKNPENLIFAEWPERIPGGMPERIERLQFSVVAEDTRNITETHG